MGVRGGGLLVVLGLAGCGGDDELLQQLDGTWIGTVTVDPAPIGLAADFAWVDFLEGELVVDDPGAPHTYAIRRSEALKDEVFLELTDVADATRGLDLDGTVDGASFTGTLSMTYPCDGQTCGYEGPFSLARGAGATTPTTPATP